VSVPASDRNSVTANEVEDAVPFTTFSSTFIQLSADQASPGAGRSQINIGQTLDQSQLEGLPPVANGPRFADREYSLATGDVLWNISSVITTAAQGTVVTNANRCAGSVLSLDARATPNSLDRGQLLAYEIRTLSTSTSNGAGAVGIVLEIPSGVFGDASVQTGTSTTAAPRIALPSSATTTTRPKGVVAVTTTTFRPLGVALVLETSPWNCSFQGRFAACTNPTALTQRSASSFATLKVRIPADAQASFPLQAAIVRDLGVNESASALLQRFVRSGTEATEAATDARFANTIAGTTVSVTVTGFTVDAGPDLPLPNTPFPVSAVPNADRTGVVPAAITLDGSRTTSDGRDQTFEWTQLSGPIVTWRTPSLILPNKGSGESTQFTSPVIRARTNFTFRLDVTATGPSGTTTKSDTVSVTLDPPPNQAPTINTLTASNTNQIVQPGFVFNLASTSSDPEGDALSFAWKVITPDLSDADSARVVTPLTNRALATVQWPANLPIPDRVTVELTVTDARGAKATRTVDVGRAPEALSVSLNTGGNIQSAQPGVVVQFLAVPSSIEAGLEFTWRQTSGAPVTLPTNTTTRSLDVTIPPTSATGNGPISLEVTLRKGTRSATASRTVNIQSATALSVDIDSPGIVAFGAITTIIPTIAGGLAPYTTTWTTEAGQTLAVSVNATTGALTFTAPTLSASTALPIPAIVKVLVRDAGGQEVSAQTIVVYGPALEAPSLSLPEICGRGILGKVITDGVKTFGLGSIATINLGTVTLPGSCSAETQVNFSGASASFFGGSLVGTALTGRVNASAICLTAGQLNADPAFGLPAADISLDAPICVNISALTGTTTGADSAIAGSPACLLSGRLTYAKLPFLDVPEVFSLNASSLTFACGKLNVRADGTIATGAFTLDVTVKNAGDFDGTVAVTNAAVFGTQLNLNGRIAKVGSNVTYSITGGIDNPNFGVPGITASRLDVTWDKRGLHGLVAGSITPNGADPIAVVLKGDFRSATNWNLTASATAGNWQIAQGLTLSKGSLVGSLSQSGSRTTFDVSLDASVDWVVIGPDALVLRSIKARIANTTPDSALCPGLQPNEAFVSLSGDGLIRPPGATTPIELSTSGCIGLSSAAFRLKLNAKLNSWRPVDSVDATIESLAFVVERNTAGQFSVEGQGSMHARGAQLDARIIFLPGTGLIIDGGGDVRSLGIPLLETGHIIFATSAQQNYQTKKFEAGQFVNDFVPFNLPAGLTLAGKFSLSADQSSFLSGSLGINVAGDLVVLASLTGSSIELKVILNLGDGIDLFRMCPALTGSQDPKLVCTDPNTTTSLTLKSGSLILSSDGSLGIGAEAALHLPPADVGQPPSNLDLGAQITIGLVPQPSISLALYKTGGDWNNALGIRGLTLGDLAIQGGIVFNPPPAPPTPTIAFLAEIRDLPGPEEELAGGIDLSSPLGILNANEGMRFAFQISQSAPIFEMTLGKQDGAIFMRPLSMVDGIEGKVARAFEVDYATLVIAPLGGKIGPITYEPGFTMGFAANVMGTPVDMKVRLGLIPPELEAHAAIGRATINGITLEGAMFDMKATSVPPTFHLEIQGSVDLGDPTMEARVLTDLEPVGQKLLFEFDGRLSNWQLNTATRLDDLSINGKAELTSFSRPPTVVLNASARGTVLGSPSAFAGSVAFNGTTLQSLDLRGAPGTFSYLGTSLRGYQNGNGLCSDLVGVAANSPCFRLRWGNTTPFALTVQAGITSGPANVDFEGGIDDNGIGGSGQLRIDGAMDPSQPPIAVTASLWTRSVAASAIPASRRPKVPRRLTDGTYVFDERNVVDGDWYVAAAANGPLKIGGFGISGALSAGKVGTTTFASGKANTTFGYTVPGSAQPILTSDILLNGVFAKIGTTTTFDLLGKGAVRVDGKPLAGATLHLTEQGATIDGNVVVPGASGQPDLAAVTLSGGVCVGACPNLIAGTTGANATALNFRFAGSSALNLPGLGMTGDFELIRIPGRTAFAVSSSLDNARWALALNGDITFSANRAVLCMRGSAQLKFDGPDATGEANFCSNTGATFTLNYAPYILTGSFSSSAVTVRAFTRIYAPSVNADGFGTCLFWPVPGITLASGTDRCREFVEIAGEVALAAGRTGFSFNGEASLKVGTEALNVNNTRLTDVYTDLVPVDVRLSPARACFLSVCAAA
jgi:hypothetical protein